MTLLRRLMMLFNSHNNKRLLSSGMDDRRAKLMRQSLPKRRSLVGVDHVILVGSGKGGVGKSTTSLNLALALDYLGYDVGILDGDIYGPSLPILMNLKGNPRVDAENRMIPLTHFGIKGMSMGFLTSDSDSAVVWRGPMVMGAIQKMIFGTDWSNLNFLIVDLPPGTGDIHLSIAQTLNVTGAILVSTPQRLALVDAKKAHDMFEKVSIPTLGLVENMSRFVCGSCGETTDLFGKSGQLTRELGIQLLGSVPMDPRIMTSSDNGEPIFLSHTSDSPIVETYINIAKTLIKNLGVK